jgi:hypothetical protein
MPSPFPGMDPFLEINPRWEAFHAWFMRKLAEQALPKAQELGCWIDVERTVYQREPGGEIVLIGEPDHTVGVDVCCGGVESGQQERQLRSSLSREAHAILGVRGSLHGN